MALTSKEAAETLFEIERTTRRSTAVFRYRESSPHFFIWAAAWAVGYVGTYVSPQHAGWIWLAVIGLGMTGSLLVGVRSDPKFLVSRSNGWRVMGVFAFIQGFITSVMLVMHGQGWEVGVLIPLLIGAMYAAIGLWAGLRYVIAGAAVMVLTLVGFFFVPQYLCLWMAVVGGGVLLLSGIWMRTV
jgi:hypothetical protein